MACKAYVVDGLDVGLLIGMDGMQREGMVLDCGKGKLIMDSHYDFTTSFSRVNDTKKAVTYHYETARPIAKYCETKRLRHVATNPHR